jgi:hypothetical protein
VSVVSCQYGKAANDVWNSSSPRAIRDQFISVHLVLALEVDIRNQVVSTKEGKEEDYLDEPSRSAPRKG